MWAIFGIVFAVLAVGAALVTGWGLPLVLIFGIALVGAAFIFLFQRFATRAASEADAAGRGSAPRTDHWWG